jgi:hypothetical protein
MHSDNLKKLKLSKDDLNNINNLELKKLMVKFKSHKKNILYFSFYDTFLNQDIEVVKKVSKRVYQSYDFFAFERNNIFDIWLASNKNIDVIFVEDIYEQRQEESFMSLLQKHHHILKNTKIVVLMSTKQCSLNKKELLSISDTVMKKSLNYYNLYKYMLSI